jgi:hypothetical protein
MLHRQLYDTVNIPLPVEPDRAKNGITHTGQDNAIPNLPLHQHRVIAHSYRTASTARGTGTAIPAPATEG